MRNVPEGFALMATDMDPVYGCDGVANDGVVGRDVPNERLLAGRSARGVNWGLSPNREVRFLALSGVCARDESEEEGLSEGVEGCCAPRLLGVWLRENMGF